ncbi:hypothetical protein B0H14DRAFT_2583206 [Mycena olivaceomarginata]|nr:hypothetical protein B0H14DRAFT_2583206 [Mycena olivaceomarginata]
MEKYGEREMFVEGATGPGVTEKGVLNMVKDFTLGEPIIGRLSWELGGRGIFIQGVGLGYPQEQFKGHLAVAQKNANFEGRNNTRPALPSSVTLRPTPPGIHVGLGILVVRGIVGGYFAIV